MLVFFVYLDPKGYIVLRAGGLVRGIPCFRSKASGVSWALPSPKDPQASIRRYSASRTGAREKHMFAKVHGKGGLRLDTSQL